ncbi:Gldg family protein [Blautia schinkii]|nr:Gldg family protein [Blautia schinkii]
MKSIYKKEMKAYLESMTGYIYLAIFMGLTAYYFVVNNLLAESNDVKEYFSNMTVALMFLLPILTMRLLSEEKKLKTEQLLLTIPLRIREILIGKYLAAFTVFGIGIGLTGIFVGILIALGGTDLITVLGCYVGIVLAGACFIAIGLFLSSLTENQTVAAIVTYAVLFGLYLISMFGDYAANPLLVKIIDYVAVFRRYTDFTMGIFDVSAACYYLSLAIAFLVFSGYVMSKERKGHGVTILLTVVIVVLFNLFVEGISGRWNLRLDMTSNKLYQISQESRELMKTVNQNVDIYCICKSRDAIVEFSEMLDKYDGSSDRITVNYVDPYSNVIYLDRLKEEGLEVGLNTIIVESGDNRRILKMADMYQFSADGKELAYFNGESMMTSAILNVTRTEREKIGIVMGHGENVGEQLQNLMIQNGFDITGVVLNQAVKNDINTLLVFAPQSDLSQSELSFLDEFFQRGGNMMYFSDPSVGTLDRVEGFLAEWGIRFQEDVIFDAKNNIESTPVNVIGYYGAHMITEYFQNHSYYTVVPAGRSLDSDFSSILGCSVEVVLSTSDNAYGRDIHTKELTTQQISTDTKGPFVLALTSEKNVAGNENGSSTAKIFAVGSKRIAEDEMLQLSSVGNSKFLAKVMEWTSGMDDTAFAIPPKQVGGDPIVIDRDMVVILGIICIAGIPLIIMVPGLWVWWKRRYL